MAEEVKSESEKKKEDWMNSKWRPMMGWMYMLVCTMDMVVFPILWSLLQSLNHGSVTSQWNPLTLQGAGLFHIAMGAVLGIAAFGRTQEKLGGANNGGMQPVGQHMAHRNQAALATPAVLIHQHRVALAEAALEAHLQHQAQVLHQRQTGAQHQ